MNISLRPDVEKFVEEKIMSGEFASADEVVNALLLQALRREELSTDDINDLRAELDVGIGEADGNDFVEFTPRKM